MKPFAIPRVFGFFLLSLQAIAAPLAKRAGSLSVSIIKAPRPKHFKPTSPHSVPASQNIPRAEVFPNTSLNLRGTSGLNNQECDFDSIQEFFEYAYRENLNITAEVQSCQNLCLLTYGTGNPDLSGIGMMHAYNLQIALTILFGPIYRLLQIGVLRYVTYTDRSKAHWFISELQAIQTLFFASNGFFILSSAVASLVRLAQTAAIFEVAEMQALAFLQLNSLLVSFFCLARPISRWVARVFFTTVVFICVIVVLGKSQLSGRRRMNWKMASDGCENGSTDFGVITPIPYPPAAVIVFAAAGVLGLCLRSIKAKFQGSKRWQILFNFLMSLWVILVGVMTAGMLIGLAMVWRQRQHLKSVVGREFQDDVWGFGQVAALFIWAPVPVELLHVLNDAAQRKYPKWDHLMKKGVADLFVRKSKKNDDTPTVIEQVRKEGESAKKEQVTVVAAGGQQTESAK